jgi:hypothetical protein
VAKIARALKLDREFELSGLRTTHATSTAPKRGAKPRQHTHGGHGPKSRHKHGGGSGGSKLVASAGGRRRAR